MSTQQFSMVERFSDKRATKGRLAVACSCVHALADLEHFPEEDELLVVDLAEVQLAVNLLLQRQHILLLVDLDGELLRGQGLDADLHRRC
jgi:hypothetical protein